MGAKTSNLTFGQALEALKKSALVRRPCWAEGAHLFLEVSEDGQGDRIMFRHYNGLAHGWMTRDDSSLLAEDWEIVG